MPNYRAVLEVEMNKRVSKNELEMVPYYLSLWIIKTCCSLWYFCLIKNKNLKIAMQVDNLYKIADDVSSEAATEAESGPVAVADPENTPSKTSGFVIFIC